MGINGLTKCGCGRLTRKLAMLNGKCTSCVEIEELNNIIAQALEKIKDFRDKKTKKNYFHHQVLTDLLNSWIEILAGK